MSLTDDAPAKNDVQPEVEGANERRSVVLALGFALFAVAAAFLTVHLFFADDASETTPRTLASLLIGRLLTFLFGLAAVVSVFHALRLSVRKYPLGLQTAPSKPS